ncbi:MAG TPA: hypothetical protein VMU14_17750 [Acidimicrobiales bacterium]|nr:hypothetical protein [Acidimicrobiales bacterium]
MMQPDIAAALAAEHRAALLAEACRRRARADLAMHRHITRYAVPRRPRIVGRLITWPLRPLLRAPGHPMVPFDCSTLVP